MLLFGKYTVDISRLIKCYKDRPMTGFTFAELPKPATVPDGRGGNGAVSVANSC